MRGDVGVEMPLVFGDFYPTVFDEVFRALASSLQPKAMGSRLTSALPKPAPTASTITRVATTAAPPASAHTMRALPLPNRQDRDGALSCCEVLSPAGGDGEYGPAVRLLFKLHHLGRRIVWSSEERPPSFGADSFVLLSGLDDRRQRRFRCGERSGCPEDIADGLDVTYLRKRGTTSEDLAARGKREERQKQSARSFHDQDAKRPHDATRRCCRETSELPATAELDPPCQCAYVRRESHGGPP